MSNRLIWADMKPNKILQILDGIAGQTSLECLTLFRHLMVDVAGASAYGHRVGALSKYAMGIEDPLSTAINDFPKRGILVRDPHLIFRVM
jgi:hypothetical protein